MFGRSVEIHKGTHPQNCGGKCSKTSHQVQVVPKKINRIVVEKIVFMLKFLPFLDLVVDVSPGFSGDS